MCGSLIWLGALLEALMALALERGLSFGGWFPTLSLPLFAIGPLGLPLLTGITLGSFLLFGERLAWFVPLLNSLHRFTGVQLQ